MTRLADPAVAAQEWAVAALINSAELAAALGYDDPAQVAQRLWDSPPSVDAELPYIILSTSDPIDMGGVGMAEVMATLELSAQVVDRAESYDPLRPYADAIHHALQGALSVPLSGGGMLLSARRIRAIAYPETTDGVEYRHLGGTYVVNVQ